MNSVVEMHKSAINLIYQKDYYISLFEKLSSFHVDKVFDMTDEEKICSFWNDFWFSLPDNNSIRREPFFLICDLAEGEYLEPVYEEQE